MKSIKDSEFIRGEVPMTKEEVRTLSLVKMGIKEDSRVLDIGAGTGSVTIGAGINCPKGSVTAIEKEEKGVKLIKENCEKFNLSNVEILHGLALEKMDTLKGKFDSIFVGGSGGELGEIIERALDMLNEGGNMVLNFITMRNALKAMDKLDDLKVEYDCVQVSVNMVKGKSKMLIAHNPIFIINVCKK